MVGSSNLSQCYTTCISMPFQIVLLEIPKFNCIYETVKDSYYHELFKLHKLLKYVYIFFTPTCIYHHLRIVRSYNVSPLTSLSFPSQYFKV